MRTIVASIITLLVTSVVAFAPQSRTLRSNRLFSVATSPRAVKSSAVKSPLDNLPWNVRKVEEREARRVRREAAKLYRELGIAEDSTYEEIMEQTSILRSRTDDFKQHVRIDLAKDRILEMRLTERIAGLAKVSSDVMEQDSYENDGVDESRVREMKKDDVDDRPSRWQGIVKKPDVVWRNRQFKVWGGMTLVGLLFPPAIEALVVLQLMILTAQLIYRGQIVDPGNMWSLSGGVKAKGSHRSYSWLLGLGILLGGKIVSFSLTPPFARGRRWTPVINYTIENAVYMYANMFLQPYKGD